MSTITVNGIEVDACSMCGAPESACICDSEVADLMREGYCYPCADVIYGTGMDFGSSQCENPEGCEAARRSLREWAEMAALTEFGGQPVVSFPFWVKNFAGDDVEDIPF